MIDHLIMLLLGTLLGGLLLMLGVLVGAWMAYRLGRGLAPLPAVADLLPTPPDDEDEEDDPPATKPDATPPEPAVASQLIRF